MENVVTLPVLKGQGFILRHFESNDAASLQHHLNDERVARKVSHIPFPYTIDHARDWISRTESSVCLNSNRIDFVIDIGGEAVGSVAFINIEGHKAQLSYWLSPDYWGKGIVSEAVKLLLSFGFVMLPLERAYGYVYSENTASARVLQKCGFRFEGTHNREWRKVIDEEVKFFDSNFYAVLRSDVFREVRDVVVFKSDTEESDLASKGLARQLSEVGVKVQIAHRADELTAPFSLAISVGGDGQMMRTVHTMSPLSVPTLGLNAGNVGFLTSARVNPLGVNQSVFQRIVQGNFQVEQRLGIQFEFEGQSYGPFSNEVLLKVPKGMASYVLSVNQEQVYADMAADGILLATATGSTGYNTAAGGPIIWPDSRSVVATALNPTTFNVRPIVFGQLAQGGEISLGVAKLHHDIEPVVSADGKDQLEGKGLRSGDGVVIRRYPRPMLFATFGSSSYLHALKEKKGFM